MRLYADNDGWEAMHDDVTFTIAVLRASGAHAGLAAPLAGHLTVWVQVDADRRAADVGVVEANAVVAWADLTLDRCTVRFATQLLADCEGDRGHALYTAFFSVAPNEITRLAVERQLEAMKTFPTLAEVERLKKGTRALLQQVLDAMEQGREALKAREAAAKRVTAVARRQAAWRDEANTRRRAVQTALDDHANKGGLARGYADGFFTAAKPAKKTRAAGAPAPPTPRAPAELSESDQVLALPDRLLRALAEEFIATLPANVQSIVRARRAG